MQLFAFVRPGESLHELANFETFGGACLLLFQCLTGDGWYGIMLDAMHGECEPSAPTDCSSWAALPYFVSFTLIGSFVFLNLVLAAVLERLSPRPPHDPLTTP